MHIVLIKLNDHPHVKNALDDLAYKLEAYVYDEIGYVKRNHCENLFDGMMIGSLDEIENPESIVFVLQEYDSNNDMHWKKKASKFTTGQIFSDPYFVLKESDFMIDSNPEMGARSKGIDRAFQEVFFKNTQISEYTKTTEVITQEEFMKYLHEHPNSVLLKNAKKNVDYRYSELKHASTLGKFLAGLGVLSIATGIVAKSAVFLVVLPFAVCIAGAGVALSIRGKRKYQEKIYELAYVDNYSLLNRDITQDEGYDPELAERLEAIEKGPVRFRTSPVVMKEIEPNNDAGRELFVKLSQQHDAIIDKFHDYELDLYMSLAFPTMVDKTVKETQEFHRALLHAKNVRESQGDTAEIGDIYYDAVLKLDLAFGAAEAHAKKKGMFAFDPESRKKAKTAQKLLNIANDDSSSTSERQVAFEQALKTMEGVAILPEKGVHKIRQSIGLIGKA